MQVGEKGACQGAGDWDRDVGMEARGSRKRGESERLKGALKDRDEARDDKEQGPCNRGAQRRAHGGATGQKGHES